MRNGSLQLRLAGPSDTLAIVALHRRDRQGGGPWMYELTCRRHLEAYWRLGFDVVVESDAGEIVGEADLWYADEPEPFGRYGHIELLELEGEAATHEVEDWIIEQAEAHVQE